MNPPAAVQRPAAGPASLPRRAPRTTILFAVVAIAGVLLVSQLLASPSFVSRVTVDNPTDYGMLVEVSGGPGDGWLPIGTVDRHSSSSFGQVYDLGDTWEFRVSSQTRDAGTFRVSRAQLERSKWHVTIPARVGETLRAGGAVPQP